EIVKAQADAAVQTAEDQTALLKAKYAVRQAELEVSKNELVSKIDAQKNILGLDEAKRALAQLEQDIRSHSASNKAALAISEEKRNKARLAMNQAEENIKKMTITAPIDGLVVIEGNRDSMGGWSLDRKSTRLNSSHSQISYAVFCLKKKKKKKKKKHKTTKHKKKTHQE